MSGPLPEWATPFAIPASWIYGRAVARRNRRYDDPARTFDAGIPAIAVGNLVAGGTGKSPMVRWIVGALRDVGAAPLVAMRGYGAKRGAADEELEYRRLIPETTLLVDPDRLAAIRRHLDSGGREDCAVLDDAFQHRRLRRALDLVLIDATRPALDDRLLPAGWLREPAEQLRRADAVVVTRAGGVDPGLAATIERLHGAAPIAWCRHAWTRLRVDGAEQPLEWLRGRRVVTSLGIGRPRPMLDQLGAAGAEVLHDEPARDHQRYDRARVAVLRERCRGADALVTTLKDLVKLEPHLPGWPVPVAVPEVAPEFLAGEAALADRVRGAVGR